jgi:hypothetical protein
MKQDLSNFYGTAAQVIPALLLILVVETSFMAAVLRYKGLWESGIGGLVAVRLIEKVKVGRGVPFLLPLGPMERALLAGIAVFVDAFFLRPTRLTNLILAVLTLLLAVVGEGLAFAGLAFDPAGTVKTIFVVIMLITLGVLIFQVFLSLVLSVFSMRASISTAANHGQLTADTSAQASLADDQQERATR